MVKSSVAIAKATALLRRRRITLAVDHPCAVSSVRWRVAVAFERGQVIANGRRIGDGGRGAPKTAASCAFRVSISARQLDRWEQLGALGDNG